MGVIEKKSAAQLAVEAQAAELAGVIQSALPKGLGFALFVFNFGDGGHLAYMSNAQREDMIKAVKEWLARQA